MLDRWFMSKLNPTGKIAYFVGQILFIVLWALVLFGGMGVSFDNGKGLWILGAIPIILVWGGLCMVLFPPAPNAV